MPLQDTGEQPLHIPREKLIEALQAKLDEAQKKRQEAEDARTASRQALLDAVEQLTNDQVANLLHRFIFRDGGNQELLKFVTEITEEKKYVSEELKPTHVETSLERYVRVLGMATDQEITVEPTDPIFPLL